MSDQSQESFVSEKMVTLIFDQVKGASEDTAKTVGALAEGITELITKIGNSPSETLSIAKRIEDLVKDLNRDSRNIKEKIEKLENLKEDVFNVDKKVENYSNKFNEVLIKLEPLNTIRSYLETISNNMWKLYTVIAIAFTLGLTVIGVVIYLQHSVGDLTKALDAIQPVIKSLPPTTP